MSDTARRVAAARQQGAAFLRPPYDNPAARAFALAAAAGLVRQAIPAAVRGGRDDLAFELLELAQRIEKTGG